MVMTRPRTLVVLGMVAGFGAIVAAQAAKPAAPAAKAAAKKARVFFIEPKNGATVTSPVHMKFGSEGVEIGAVPPGEITAAQVRKGIAHYHVGIDQDCLGARQDHRQRYAVVGAFRRRQRRLRLAADAWQAQAGAAARRRSAQHAARHVPGHHCDCEIDTSVALFSSSAADELTNSA
jgi:ribosomal protein S5